MAFLSSSSLGFRSSASTCLPFILPLSSFLNPHLPPFPLAMMDKQAFWISRLFNRFLATFFVFPIHH